MTKISPCTNVPPRQNFSKTWIRTLFGNEINLIKQLINLKSCHTYVMFNDYFKTLWTYKSTWAVLIILQIYGGGPVTLHHVDPTETGNSRTQHSTFELVTLRYFYHQCLGVIGSTWVLTEHLAAVSVNGSKSAPILPVSPRGLAVQCNQSHSDHLL